MGAKLRRILHVLTAEVLYKLGFWTVRNYLSHQLSSRVKATCVLCLHRVLSDEQRKHSSSLESMILCEGTFEKLLIHIRRQFRLTSMDHLQISAPENADGSKPLCILTFDDGWNDNYSTAYPLLKKYGISATIFLATGMLGTQGGFWIEELVRAWKDPIGRAQIQARFPRSLAKGDVAPDLWSAIEYCKRMPAGERQEFLSSLGISSASIGSDYRADQLLTWEQVKEMSSDGIEFGSHTVTHPLLTYENDATVRQELTTSKKIIQEKLDKEVRSFAYPNGDWDERIRNLVKEAGYQVAFTTERGLHCEGRDPYTIRRIMLHEGNVTGLNGQFSPAMLSLRLSGWY